MILPFTSACHAYSCDMIKVGILAFRRSAYEGPRSLISLASRYIGSRPSEDVATAFVANKSSTSKYPLSARPPSRREVHTTFAPLDRPVADLGPLLFTVIGSHLLVPYQRLKAFKWSLAVRRLGVGINETSLQHDIIHPFTF